VSEGKKEFSRGECQIGNGKWEIECAENAVDAMRQQLSPFAIWHFPFEIHQSILLVSLIQAVSTTKLGR
jgi:hypothetical protein